MLKFFSVRNHTSEHLACRDEAHQNQAHHIYGCFLCTIIDVQEAILKSEIAKSDYWITEGPTRMNRSRKKTKTCADPDHYATSSMACTKNVPV